MSLYDAQGLSYGCDREYSQAINYKIDTVDPSDWTPSGSYSHGSITVKKGKPFSFRFLRRYTYRTYTGQ